MKPSDAHPLAGTSYLVAPLEKHKFVVGADDFLCGVCGRGRALHEDRGVLVFADTPWRPSNEERKEFRAKDMAP